MKRYTIVLAAIVFVIAMVGGAYAASFGEDVAVTATVSGLCKVGTSGAMSFAIPDPSIAGPIAASGITDASVFCTNAWGFNVTALSANKGGSTASCGGAGITGTLKDGANTMDYTFTCGTGAFTGSGFAVAKNLSIGGSIAQAAYINAPASALYADTITLTINY